jgi:hypothetical protein
MVGKAQPFDITRKYGTPLRKDKSGNSEYLCYHIPYKYPNGAQGSRGFEGGYAAGSGSEVFDDLTIEFDAKGDIKSWRGYI